jgi:shikimate dehydrogenase
LAIRGDFDLAEPRAFVIGHPIGHSRSPMMHGYWLKRYGIAGSYEKIDVAPEAIPAFFARFRQEGWIGGNVTVPHKVAVMAHVEVLDDAAMAMGAANILWWKDGKLTGGNTDALGFLGNIDEQVPGWDRTARRALILGAGGAARAAVYGMITRGLSVAICNRTLGKAQDLARHFGHGAEAHGLADLPALLAEAEVVVNATSLGMAGKPPNRIDLAALKPGAVVYDVVYVPLKTDLLKAAAARGNPTVDGLGMLLHQGVEGFRRWFGTKPEVAPGLRKLLEDDIRATSPGA